MSDGASFHSQPENTRLQWPCGSATSTWTKAPVSCSGSHGAVVSQARRRMMTLSTRIAWPGFSSTSRDAPLRLLSSPSTATRSAIGVVPSGSSLASGRAGSAGGGAWFSSFASSPPQPAASASRTAAPPNRTRRKTRPFATYSGVQAW